MSNLSGYDSEAVGFTSISQNKSAGNTCSTQTTEFSESGVGSQTNTSRDCGCMATPEDLNAQNSCSYTPGLNEFLKKVVPTMMEQLDQQEFHNSSDSEEEEVFTAKLIQEFKANVSTPSLGSGDHQSSTILDLSFSSAGNSLAVSIGKSQHEQWCQHDGLIRVYTIKRAEDNKFVHALDITEKNCVSVLKYHPSVAALLAYGTTSGDVVICSLRNTENSAQALLTSPSGCHGSKRVSALKWADSTLANTYLTMQILNTGKRRGASDQILITAGSDEINIWQVNSNLKIFESVVGYSVNGSRKMAAPDISCFDYIKTYPLRPCDEKIPDDIFVVGTKCGKLYICKIKNCTQIMDSSKVDPVFEVFEGHQTCVLDVTFSYQRPGVFASISMDSELRLYSVSQMTPLKVLFMDSPLTCISWLPNSPCCVLCGVRDGALIVYDEARGAPLPASGLRGEAICLTIVQAGATQVAAGASDGTVRIWELPPRTTRYWPEDL